MGHSQNDKAASHQRIVAIAAARFRESGTGSPAIGELMRAAQLTHGGFYKHFGSRDELVDEAVELALRTGAERMAAAATGDTTDEALGALIDGYLSAGHRDAPASSCAVATLSADVARGSDRARGAYTDQVRSYLELVEASISDPDPARRRRRALLTLSSLVGAVLMARAVDSPALSDELLAEVAEALRSN